MLTNRHRRGRSGHSGWLRQVRFALTVKKCDVAVVAEQINRWAEAAPPHTNMEVEGVEHLPGRAVKISIGVVLPIPAER